MNSAANHKSTVQHEILHAAETGGPDNKALICIYFALHITSYICILFCICGAREAEEILTRRLPQKMNPLMTINRLASEGHLSITQKMTEIP